MKLALWLMGRFGVPQQNPSLIGDIAEEWASGRSAWWLLRQTTVAVARALHAGLWDHKWITLRALAVGWAAAWGWMLILLLAQPPLGVRYRGDEWNRARVFVLLLYFTIWVLPAIIASLVVRLHRIQPLGMLLLLVVTHLSAIAYMFVRHWTEWQHGLFMKQMSFAIEVDLISLGSLLLGGLLAAHRSPRVNP